MAGRQIYVYHSRNDIVGQNLTIEIKRVINPPTTRPTDSFLIKTEWDVLNNGVYYQIDQNLVDVKYKVN